MSHVCKHVIVWSLFGRHISGCIKSMRSFVKLFWSWWPNVENCLGHKIRISNVTNKTKTKTKNEDNFSLLHYFTFLYTADYMYDHHIDHSTYCLTNTCSLRGQHIWEPVLMCSKQQSRNSLICILCSFRMFTRKCVWYWAFNIGSYMRVR